LLRLPERTAYVKKVRWMAANAVTARRKLGDHVARRCTCVGFCRPTSPGILSLCMDLGIDVARSVQITARWTTVALALLMTRAAAAQPSHDAVVLPQKPLRVGLAPGVAAVSRKVRISVVNADIAPGSTTIQLTATSGDCPLGTIASQPDFAPGDPNIDTVVTLGNGKTKFASVLLNVASAAFSTFNNDAPNRCRVTFTAASTVIGNVDPNPTNNSSTLEIDVSDRNDPEQTAVHESVLASLRIPHPGKIKINDGAPSGSRVLRPTLINADAGEISGHMIDLGLAGGNCPPGVVGAADFDATTPGSQSAVSVPGSGRIRGTLPLAVTSADFFSPSEKSPQRCTAILGATGPAGDTEVSNNTTWLVIDVVDRNDF